MPDNEYGVGSPPSNRSKTWVAWFAMEIVIGIACIPLLVNSPESLPVLLLFSRDPPLHVPVVRILRE